MSNHGEKEYIISLKEVQQSLWKRRIFWVPNEKIEEYYFQIDDYGYLFVSEPNKKWMVCSEENDDERLACHEIVTMLDLDSSVFNDYYFIVSSIINQLCEEFSEMTQRDKIPFYIAVMHIL